MLSMGSYLSSSLLENFENACCLSILFWILLQDHYASISRGIIDLRDIFYYLLVILVFLNATYFVADKMEKF